MCNWKADTKIQFECNNIDFCLLNRLLGIITELIESSYFTA